MSHFALVHPCECYLKKEGLICNFVVASQLPEQREGLFDVVVFRLCWSSYVLFGQRMMISQCFCFSFCCGSCGVCVKFETTKTRLFAMDQNILSPGSITSIIIGS